MSGFFPTLGTAALKNTGVSGDAVPVLNGAAVTWANSQTVGGGGSANAGVGITVNGTSHAANGGSLFFKRDGTNSLLIGDTPAALGSGTGSIFYQFGTVSQYFYVNGSQRIEISNTGLIVNGTISATLLGNYANDSLASAGGVAVGQFYRNGSVVMQRAA